MSIRKIKANAARVEGDYVLVEDYSRKSLGAILGFILGIIIVIVLKTDLMVGMVVIFFSVFMLSGRDLDELKELPIDELADDLIVDFD